MSEPDASEFCFNLTKKRDCKEESASYTVMHLDSALHLQNIEYLDKILSIVDVENVNPLAGILILRKTFAVRSQLKNWHRYLLKLHDNFKSNNRNTSLLRSLLFD